MKVTADMKVKEVLAIDEEKMLDAFFWLAPEFERLRYKKLRRAMSGRVNVAQAARIARIPLTEVLYILNLAAGEDAESIADELAMLPRDNFEFLETNPPRKPKELEGVSDTDENVIFVDVMGKAERREDPIPPIVRGLVQIKNPEDILLIQHPFDPIPLRDMFARRGLASWAEERFLGNWFIYFYRPSASQKAEAYPSIENRNYRQCASSV